METVRKKQGRFLFGFIERDHGMKLYFHETGMAPNQTQPVEGARVQFKVTTGTRGERAEQVTIITPATAAAGAGWGAWCRAYEVDVWGKGVVLTGRLASGAADADAEQADAAGAVTSDSATTGECVAWFKPKKSTSWTPCHQQAVLGRPYCKRHENHCLDAGEMSMVPPPQEHTGALSMDWVMDGDSWVSAIRKMRFLPSTGGAHIVFERNGTFYQWASATKNGRYSRGFLPF